MKQQELGCDLRLGGSRNDTIQRKLVDSWVYQQWPLPGRNGGHGWARLPTHAARVTSESMVRDIGLRHRPRKHLGEP